MQSELRGVELEIRHAQPGERKRSFPVAQELAGVAGAVRVAGMLEELAVSGRDEMVVHVDPATGATSRGRLHQTCGHQATQPVKRLATRNGGRRVCRRVRCNLGAGCWHRSLWI